MDPIYIVPIVAVLMILIFGANMLRRVKFNGDVRWGGWVKIRRVIYATGREEFVVEAYNEHEMEFFDRGSFSTLPEAEAHAEQVFDTYVVKEEPVVIP